jgi:hypothetical protein
MKLLLYGNCQLSVIGDWLSRFESLEILKPQHYGVPTVHPWEDKLFFPGTVSQTPDSIYKALSDCDLFIFHHCKKDIFVKTKHLYDVSDAKKLCVTSFYFDAYDYSRYGEKQMLAAAEENIKNLKDRHNTNKKLYGNDCLDMSSWVSDNWRDKFISSETRHPRHFYYKEMSNVMCNSFFEKRLGITPITKPFETHKGTKNNIENILRILPNILVY